MVTADSPPSRKGTESHILETPDSVRKRTSTVSGLVQDPFPKVIAKTQTIIPGVSSCASVIYSSSGWESSLWANGSGGSSLWANGSGGGWNITINTESPTAGVISQTLRRRLSSPLN